MESRKRYLAHLLMTLLSNHEYATMTLKEFNSLKRFNLKKYIYTLITCKKKLNLSMPYLLTEPIKRTGLIISPQVY